MAASVTSRRREPRCMVPFNDVAIRKLCLSTKGVGKTIWLMIRRLF